mgnify:CR=1 FL=1
MQYVIPTCHTGAILDILTLTILSNTSKNCRKQDSLRTVKPRKHRAPSIGLEKILIMDMLLYCTIALGVHIS